MPFPYIYTFYSYKGGVGRSMAMLNVAYALAGKGRHVLAIDMDLEAPGVSGFLHRNSELEEQPGVRRQDIVSLLLLCKDAIRDKVPVENIAPVQNFHRRVRPEKLASLKPKYGKVGRLDVIGADQDRDYLDRLGYLALKDMPQDDLIALSRYLHKYFKQQRFPFRPLGVEEPEPPIQTPYDYVLIDSRTGITEIGGLCVGPLSDRLVVLCGLNDQNIEGTKLFLDEVGLHPLTSTSPQKAWDDADPRTTNPPNARTLGPKPTILVASPVPTSEETEKNQRIKVLEKRLQSSSLHLSYHPLMALLERIFVRDYAGRQLTLEYSKLTNAVMEQVGDLPEQSFPKLIAANWDDSPEMLDSALRLAAANPEIGSSLLWGITQQEITFSVALRNRIFATLAEDPDIAAPVLNNWGLSLSYLARTMQGPEADLLFESAKSKLMEAERIRPGLAAYPMACIEAFQGRVASSIEYLKISDLNPSEKNAIASRSDFDPIRNTPEFQAFLATLPDS